ncbi:hypothetical protein NC652_041331 [Populus alba x Populus x berolinensis]|nr:hypothetical protein NC652_041331 [Populus alba x Populus x berolinensis]
MAGGPWLSGYGRAKPRTPGMAAAFSKMRGGKLVPTLVNVVEASTCAIQKRCGSKTVHKRLVSCCPGEMRVPYHTHGYVTRLNRQDGLDKVTLVLLLPTEKRLMLTLNFITILEKGALNATGVCNPVLIGRKYS